MLITESTITILINQSKSFVQSLKESFALFHPFLNINQADPLDVSMLSLYARTQVTYSCWKENTKKNMIYEPAQHSLNSHTHISYSLTIMQSNYHHWLWPLSEAFKSQLVPSIFNMTVFDLLTTPSGLVVRSSAGDQKVVRILPGTQFFDFQALARNINIFVLFLHFF